MDHPFEPYEQYAVDGRLLNSIYKIVNKYTAITPDEHRDLQNLMFLVKSDSIKIDHKDY